MRLAIEVCGRGPDLVLLHGWGMSSRAWGRARVLLAEHYRVHAVDLPGHGESEPSLAVGHARFAEALAERVPRPVRIAGWSLGGQIALAWALASPGDLKWIALIAATPCFVQRPGWEWAMPAATFAAFRSELELDVRGTLARFGALMSLGAVQGRATATWLRDCINGSPVPDIPSLEQGLANLHDMDLRERVDQVRQPVLVLHGTLDRIVPIEAARFLAGRLPGARLVPLQSAGHAPFLSHPEPTVAAIREFDDAR